MLDRRFTGQLQQNSVELGLAIRMSTEETLFNDRKRQIQEAVDRIQDAESADSDDCEDSDQSEDELTFTDFLKRKAEGKIHSDPANATTIAPTLSAR